ncbi:MAG: hypothetical protein QGG42_11435 [Phycisphaerae bacterium]|jgi:hypothetical protein|nr:hypothetical protein [Phycisphaerae bacterium]
MTAIFEPSLATTGIGSVPLADPDAGAAFVLDADVSIPFWPQLPKRCFREQIIPQYAQAMPCVTIDDDAENVTFDPADKQDQLQQFYEAYLSEDLEPFALTEQFAAGFGAMIRQADGRTWPMVKGHTVGPISFTVGIYDADKQPLFSDPQLRDAAVKMLTRNAQWQIKQLSPLASDRVLMFLDEPALAAYGSSTYLYISEQDVREMLGEVFDAIRSAGGVTAIHVCGNSDWGVMIRSGVDVVNFDAHQFGTTIALYADDVRDLFDRGGSIAWGIVPTSPAVVNETLESLTRRLDECFASLEAKGFDRDLLRRRAILTPSCGVGTLTPDQGRKVFELLRGLRDSLV